MADPGFKVNLDLDFGDNTATEKVELVIYKGGLRQSCSFSAGNAILLGKQLQRQGTDILDRRKRKNVKN